MKSSDIEDVSPDYSGYIGYLKYTGELVKEGYMDARKSGEALIGFDESLRFFLGENDFLPTNYEIPIRIRKGSWEALIPQVALLTVGGVGIVATAYLSTAAHTLATNDFKEKTSADLIKDALSKMQSVIRIAKHVGGMAIKDIKGVTWLNRNTIVSLPGSNGERMEFSVLELNTYISTPPKLLAKIAAAVEDERVLRLAVIEDGLPFEVEVNKSDQSLFYKDSEVIEEVLPELRDGEIVTLVGKITRGNQKTNGIGIEYKDHILNCRPESGTVVKYKEYLFSRCKLTGIVDRKSGRGLDKKPQIIIISLVNLDENNGQEAML